MEIGSHRLQALLAQAAQTHVLHLPHLALDRVPREVFSISGLVRLDLGHNNLTTLPDALGQLTSYVSHVKLRETPAGTPLPRAAMADSRSCG